MVEIDRRKAALIAELEISRGEIRSSIRACEDSLDLLSLVRRNVRSNLKFWLPGAALGGWVASKLLTVRLGRTPRPREPFQSRAGGPSSGSWLGSLLKVGFDLMRPTLLEMATEWLTRKYSGYSAVPRPSGEGRAAAEEERQAHTRNGIF